MRVSACMIAHYGADYAGYAIQSIIDAVDEVVVSYTPHPSHGTRANIRCPETREQIRAAVDFPKVRWTEVDAFWQEGKHRDYALSICGGDLVLVVDCDEIWDPKVLGSVLQYAWDGTQRNTLVACLTPWRSFNWLCRDDMMPVRVIKPSGTGDKPFPLDKGRFWHFGYAVKSSIMQYKWKCHGHIAELRPNWYAEKWEPWPPVKDVHPTGCGPWNPEPFDRLQLPEIMRRHPFYNLEKID